MVLGFIPDDFLTRALLAGIGFTIIAGPLGCFVVWQRLAYLGDSMAHSALLGIALALILNFNLMFGVFGICLIVALALARIRTNSSLSSDSYLGILSHATLALGLVLVSLMYWVRVDILDYLFGNIISVNWQEIGLIYVGGGLALGVMIWRWQALIGLTVNEQIAAAEGLNPIQTRYLLMIILAATIAIGMKIVGIILTVSLLIIPAATARLLTRTPEQMAVMAAIIGAAAVVGGLLLSLEVDTPPGPSIVVIAMALFLLATLIMFFRRIGESPN